MSKVQKGLEDGTLAQLTFLTDGGKKSFKEGFAAQETREMRRNKKKQKRDVLGGNFQRPKRHETGGRGAKGSNAGGNKRHKQPRGKRYQKYKQIKMGHVALVRT